MTVSHASQARVPYCPDPGELYTRCWRNAQVATCASRRERTCTCESDNEAEVELETVCANIHKRLRVALFGPDPSADSGVVCHKLSRLTRRLERRQVSIGERWPPSREFRMPPLLGCLFTFERSTSWQISRSTPSAAVRLPRPRA